MVVEEKKNRKKNHMSSQTRSGSKRARSSAPGAAGAAGEGSSEIDLTQMVSRNQGESSARLGKISQASALIVVDTIDRYEDALKRLEGNLAQTITCTDHQLDAVAHSTVRFMLFSNSNKEGGIVSRADVMKHIGQHLVAQRRGVPELVLAKAQYLLASCFGMNMIELVKPTAVRSKNVLASQEAGGQGGAKYFTLKSLVPKEVYKETVGKTDDASVDAQWGLLGVIISLINMSGGMLVEEEMWRHLNAMGVDKMRRHAILGGTGLDIVDDFVRKRYLKVEKQAGLDEDARSYMVAENALSEITDDDVMVHVQGELARESTALTI